MNPYLKRLREQAEALRSSMEDVQIRAANETRDLTDEEETLVRGQADRYAKMAEQIRILTEQENRAADVADAARDLDERTETRTSSTTATDRDPGFYRSEAEGGTRSFFGDMWAAKQGDSDASQRLSQHNRAINPTDNGVGLVAPRWMGELYQDLTRQGRVLADAVRRIPLGGDPRPITIPKTTAGTDANVVELSDNCGDVTWTDAYDTDVDTVTPKVTTGGQIICRSMLDMASPAVDELIFGDLIAAYNEKIEAKVAAAIITAAGAAVTTFATEAAFNTGQAALNAIIDAEMAVWEARKLPADLLVTRVRRLGSLRKLRDADGRPLVPTLNGGAQAVNANGTSTQTTATIEGLTVVPTVGMGTTAYPESMVVQRAQDVLLFESNQLRFNDPYTEGPSKLRLAIWTYTAVHVRYAGSSGKRIVVTAAS